MLSFGEVLDLLATASARRTVAPKPPRARKPRGPRVRTEASVARATAWKREARKRPEVQAREREYNARRNAASRIPDDEIARRKAARSLVAAERRVACAAATRERNAAAQRAKRAATPIEVLRARNVLDARNKRSRDAGMRAGLAFRLAELLEAA